MGCYVYFAWPASLASVFPRFPWVLAQPRTLRQQRLRALVHCANVVREKRVHAMINGRQAADDHCTSTCPRTRQRDVGSCWPLPMKTTLSRLAVVAAIVAAGCVLSGFFYTELSANEASLSRESFRGAFSYVQKSITNYFVSQIRAIRAVADSVKSHGTLPSQDTFALVREVCPRDGACGNDGASVIPETVGACAVPCCGIPCVSLRMRASITYITQIGRVYYNLFGSAVGSIAVVSRANNTAGGIATWVSAASARYGRPISPFSFTYKADMNDSRAWFLQDPLPPTPLTLANVGFRLSAVPQVRDALHHLTANFDSDVIDTNCTECLAGVFDGDVAVTGMFPVVNSTGAVVNGLVMLTPIFDDSLDYIIASSTQLQSFTLEATALSKYVGIQVTDHLNISASFGGCARGDPGIAQVLTSILPITSTVEWRVDILQCPGYEASFVSWKRYLILGTCIFCMALAVAVCLSVWTLQDKKVGAAVHDARVQEKIYAQQLVVGYVCHELRNPLHIVKTAFRAMVTSMTATSPRGNTSREGNGSAVSAFHSPAGMTSQDDYGTDKLSVPATSCSENGEDDSDDEPPPTEEELHSIIEDARSALVQMQTTLNDVLDYRSLEAGVGALKLNKQPISLAKVLIFELIESVVMTVGYDDVKWSSCGLQCIVPVLMRCRAFLPPGVELNLVCKDQDAVVAIDRVRLSQIITNGMRYR